MSPAPKSICIVRLSAIGDVAHMLAVARTLQKHWPNTQLTWVIGKNEAQLVRDIDGIEYIIFDKKKGLRAYIDLRRQLKGRSFDAVLAAQVSLRANLITAMLRSPYKLGFDSARSRDFHSLVINHQIPARDEHVLDGFFSFVEELGLKQRELSWNIPLDEDAIRFAQKELPRDKTILAISPCSSHALRNASAELYAQVADHAVEKHSMAVVLLGGPSQAERDMGSAIQAKMQHPSTSLIGKDTLKKLVAILRNVTILLTPDSGPAHLATCVDTPVLGLHAASNPKRSGPYLSQQWCVDHYPTAALKFLNRPIEQVRWGTKIEQPGVMDLIRVNDVIVILDRFMQERTEK